MSDRRHSAMRMSRLGLLGALAALAGCGREAADPRGLRPGETLLSLSATGRAEAVPDEALFTAGLSTIAPEARAASARNAQAMGRIVTGLARLGISARDIQTRNISLERIGYGANRGRYEASNSVAVKVRDVRRVGAAIAETTAAGANIVSGPQLSVADPEKASLGAYAAAYRAARAKAEAYAAAAGLRIVRIVSIQDGGDGAAVVQMDEMAARAAPTVAAPAPPPVMAGTNTSVVATRVAFALAPR